MSPIQESEKTRYAQPSLRNRPASAVAGTTTTGRKQKEPRGGGGCYQHRGAKSTLAFEALGTRTTHGEQRITRSSVRARNATLAITRERYRRSSQQMRREHTRFTKMSIQVPQR